jgi:Class III cytochrome C family
MRNRSLGWVVLGVVTFGLLSGTQVFSGPASSEDMCVPMGAISLEPPEGVQPKRSAVEFPHARHFDIACLACHHTWGRTEPIVGCTTSGCHDLAELPKKKPGEPADEEATITYFKTAYHKMCITCHKEGKARNLALQKSLKTLNKPLPKAGPTTCSGCHPK